MRIGPYLVRSIDTGTLRLDGGAMFGTVPRVLWEKGDRPDERNRIELAARCLYLEGMNRRVLVDTGLGEKWTETERDRFDLRTVPGGARGAVAAAGIDPDSVTDVILTHLHFDHAGGATRADGDGRLVPSFPNARYHLQRRNLEWARRPNDRERASYRPENFEPLAEADRFVLRDGPCDILPGVQAVVSDGHTEGMQLVRVVGEDESGDPVELWYTADLVPTSSHVPLPWIAAYDLRASTSLEEKRALLDGIAGRNAWLFYEHDPRIAASRVVRETGKHRAVDGVGGLS